VDGVPGEAPPADTFLKLRRTLADEPDQDPIAPGALSGADREKMMRAMEGLKREAARLRDELSRMRAEVDRLPPADGAR
jgi:hypothetical protein